MMALWRFPPARVSRLRRLLAGRVSAMSAPQESERIVDLLIEEEEDVESFRTELARSGPVYTSELGELWLSMAIATHDHGRQEDLLGTAYTALDRAAQLLAVASPWRRGARRSPSGGALWRRPTRTSGSSVASDEMEQIAGTSSIPRIPLYHPDANSKFTVPFTLKIVYHVTTVATCQRCFFLTAKEQPESCRAASASLVVLDSCVSYLACWL